ncbi:MAG: HAD hydrolase-like protein [Nitrospira sp.]|nr:HAD hydrolase-like protein [Nitrospira sp.]
MIKAIIFDFDGVIVESVDIKTKAFARLFEHEGEAVVEKVVDYHLKNGGVSRFDKFRYYYKEILGRPLPEQKFEELCNRFSELVMDEVINAPYVKGSKEFLDKYYNAYPCFVATGTPQEEIDEIIRQREMTHYFKKVFGAPKKKDVIVRDILDGYSLKPHEVIYVGDAMSDYQAAYENSVRFIARIHDNESIFNDIECIKIMDLTGLGRVIFI